MNAKPVPLSPQTPATFPRATTGLTAVEVGIFAALHAAIVEQRLLPGTRLIEEELAAIYRTSRMRIRRVLLALAHEGVIALPPGRGAQVACPSVEDAKSVFQARRLIEAGLIEAPGAALAPPAIAALRQCLRAETAANQVHDRAGMIAQSGLFHLELARGLGNPVIADIVSTLVSRSSLIIALFQRNSAVCCRLDEHAVLIEALEAGRFGPAAVLMRDHLDAIEAGLDIEVKPGVPNDLRAILART